MWEQPKTIKLYLHPPLANRQITFWPDFKLVNKAVVPPKGVEPDDWGLRFLFGEALHEPDWGRSEWRVRDDGLPIPGLYTVEDGLSVTLEAFCTVATQPVTYVKLKLENQTMLQRQIRLGLMLRSGLDRLLIGMDGDYYASYRPTLGHWDMVTNSWQIEGTSLTDGRHHASVALPDGAAIRWETADPNNHALKNLAVITLPIGAFSEEEIFVALGSEVVAIGSAAYETAKGDTEAFWQGEMAKIERKPALPHELDPMFNSLVVQCLQMLVLTGDGEVWPRQGGRYDGIWPVEAMEWLHALDHIGLHEWTRQGLEVFRQHQVMKGEERGRFMGINSPHWQNETGGVLYALAGHLLSQDDPAILVNWREPILDAIGYVERLREQTKTDPANIGYGLLPPGIGHDWQYKGQYWCFTDTIVFLGLREMGAALSKYRDPDAARVTAMVADYKACLERTLQRVVAGQEAREDVYIPNVLGIAETYPPFGPYATDGPSNLIRVGILDPNTELFTRLERYWRKLGWMQNGLTNPMTECLMTQGYFADPWAGNTWYTNFSDMHWFIGYMARGDMEKAREILWAQLRYGMSKEFYMQERYAANDPTFCPWQPNASANGRTIEMLFSFFGEQ